MGTRPCHPATYDYYLLDATEEENLGNIAQLYEHKPHPFAYIEESNNLDFLKQFGDEQIKLVVTSPPYNIGKEYEKRTPLEGYIQSQARIISECVRVLHPNGSLCWQVGNFVKNGEIFPLDIELYHVFRDHGLKLRNRIIWHFGHGLHCKNRFSGRYETILWFTKGDEYTFNLDSIRVPSKYPGKKHFKGPKVGELSGNPLGKNPSDIWDIPNVKSNHVEKTEHPCQFPIALIERLVLSMTDRGDSVLDPYMGVGSAVIAAAKNNRFGFGCDTERKYVDIARQRLEKLAQGKLKVRPLGKPVYDPKKKNGGH